MAFTSFASVDELLRRYNLSTDRQRFLSAVPGATFSAAARDEIEFVLTSYPHERSEVAARESLIFPILKDVWRQYRDQLTMLSGEPLVYDADLRGEVDYLVCRRSPQNPFTPEQPYLLIGEAKRDDEARGWTQVLGGMVAAQKLDAVPGRVYYGLATTGRSWSFGKLAAGVFIQDPDTFGTHNLDELAGALHFVFAACRDQLLTTQPEAAP